MRVRKMRGKERDPITFQPLGNGKVLISGYEPWEEMELVKYGARRKGTRLYFLSEEEMWAYKEAHERR